MRTLLIFAAIMLACTGYGQNQRAASYTATVALTNTGKHNQFASDANVKLGSGATGVMLTNTLPGATPLVAFRATDNADYASVLGLTLQAWTGSTRNFIADGPGNAVGLPSGGTFGFSSTTDAAGTKDVGLVRAAAGRMLVNNGAGTEPDGALDFGAGTAYGTFTIRNALAIPPTHILTLAVNQQTNAYQQIVTNAHFQVLFGGTPADGARGQFDIKNTAATNITVTWPISWSIAQAALITTFTAYSNSITEVFWAFESGSNRVRVASKEIVENFLNPSAGQVVAFHDANTRTNLTVAGTGDVTASAAFAVDNVVIRSDGTGKGVQASGITIDDSNNLGTPAGVRGLTGTFTNTLTTLGPLILQTANDPDVTAEGSLTWDANGDWLRAFDGTVQIAVARKIEAIHCTVVLPNDLADSERDAFWVWSNESGMSFIVTGWKGWSDTDDTTLNIEEIDADGQNNATVDAVEIATNGTGLFTGSDATITGATIENGHLLVLDFDDTDTPGQVKITIFGYYAADVN